MTAKPFNRDLLNARLQVAERILRFTTQIQQLKELLPICSYCRRIRDGQDNWEQLETYLTGHTSSEFSHGICPDCFAKHVTPELKK